jgi:hypothetical protein
MSSIRRMSLETLGHPICLFAIGLLILNDHFLKNAIPSVITGKLSDFAGLFFFPFLLMVFVSRLPFLENFPFVEWISKFSFVFTAAFFTAVKTTSQVNGVSTIILSHLLRYPISIVLDPTDLIALTALIPAWFLWRRIERTPHHQTHRRAVIGFCFASLATLATSPAYPPSIVDRVAYTNDFIYYRLTNPSYVASSYYYESTIRIANSYEKSNWVEIKKPPAVVLQQLNRTVVNPLVVCDPALPKDCFRTNRDGRIYFSDDGGRSWNTLWDRSQFVEDDSPYDLAVGSISKGTMLLAAMGRQGLLVRLPDGSWHTYFGPSDHWTYGATDLSETISVTKREIIVLITIILLSFIALYTCRYLFFNRFLSGINSSTAPPFIPRALLILSLIPTSVFIISICIEFYRQFAFLGFTGILPLLTFSLIGLIFLAACAVIWSEKKEFAAYGIGGRGFIGYSAFLLFTSFCLFFIAWIPFVLWASSTIMFYNTALLLSGIILLVGILPIFLFHSLLFGDVFHRIIRGIQRRTNQR